MQVSRLRPNNNLENIPAMLRSTADDIERGELPDFKSLFLIGLDKDSEVPPMIFSFGKELSRTEEVGAFWMCIQIMSQLELVPE